MPPCLAESAGEAAVSERAALPTRRWGSRLQALGVSVGVPAAVATATTGLVVAGLVMAMLGGVMRLLLRRQDNARKRRENEAWARGAANPARLDSTERRKAALAALQVLRTHPAEPFRPD